MAESQKEASSATDPKKNSLPEDCNGNDFLVSWNSAAEDKDELGFSTGADPRERMKFFDFGKLDDFEFDAEFGKVPSFKLDMPDLDFSSPKKRSAKSKERSRGEAISEKPERKANFSFSFDFNELDSFDIDTNLIKEENKLNKINENEGSDIFVNESKNFQKSGIANCFNRDASLGSKVELDTRNEWASSSPAELDQSGLPKELWASPLKPKISSNGSNHETYHPEQTLMVGSKILNAGKLVQETSVQSSDFLRQSANLQIQTASLSSVTVDEHCQTIGSSSATLDANSDEQNDNNCMRLEGSSQSKANSPVRAHDPQCLTAFSTENSLRAENVPEKNQVDKNSVGQESVVFCEPQKIQKVMEENSLAPVCDKFSVGGTSNRDQRNAGSKLQLSLIRDSKCEQFAATKDNGSTSLQLLLRNKTEATGPKVNSSITPKQLYAICNRKMETTSTRHYNLQGEHTGHGEQSGSYGGAFNRSFDLSMKIVPLTAKIHILLSGLQYSKTCFNQWTSKHHKYSKKSDAVIIETKSEVNSKGNKAETLTSPLASHSVTLEKRVVWSPSLKRKSIEVDPAAVKFSKRVLQSPSEGRQKETSGGSYGDADLDDQNRSVDAHQESSAMDFEVPLLNENDGNIEKAEACTKELENICSMLRRKHEEAKELLVRAIVTNNSLLMLDHPLYEEKISFLLCSLHQFANILALQRLAGASLSKKYDA
ncbi:unnamed protein product [Spirodela intermedia]|uniref:Uncharacterized protein n=1 Tax=Spirodela intermedia TaxID=51605 RepID=A0A7I8KXP3_SPIIN|nr:unnamed protein product [Spirodela intermedia]